MNHHRPTAARTARWIALAGWLLAASAQAQAVYRCGNSYGTTPCAGGQPVAVDDARSDAQRQQALAARKQEADLARALIAERREREREQAAGARLAAAGIGPTRAERLRAEADAAKAAQHAKAKAEPRRHARRAKHAAGTTSKV